MGRTQSGARLNGDDLKEKTDFALTGRQKSVRRVISGSIGYTAKAIRFQFSAVGTNASCAKPEYVSSALSSFALQRPLTQPSQSPKEAKYRAQESKPQH